MREFAILDIGLSDKINENIVNHLENGSKISIFTDNRQNLESTLEKNDGYDISVVEFPEEIRDNEAKKRNYILNQRIKSGFKGFFHVISSTTKINSDPGNFMSDLEEMMDKLHLKSWFNTSCDPVNYVYSRFNPRFFIDIDDPEAMKRFSKKILLCSNANTVWTCFNFNENILPEDVMLKEDFTISMFYIIEFLSRRRNMKKPGEFYYMNMYPTIESEIGVFEQENIEEKLNDGERNKRMSEENEIFVKMGLDYHPDSNIIQISEDLRNILVC